MEVGGRAPMHMDTGREKNRLARSNGSGGGWKKRERTTTLSFHRGSKERSKETEDGKGVLPLCRKEKEKTSKGEGDRCLRELEGGLEVPSSRVP